MSKIVKFISVLLISLISVQSIFALPAEAASVLSVQYDKKYALVVNKLKSDEETMKAVDDFGHPTVFFSVSDGKSKAKVFLSQSNKLDTALETAFGKAKASGITPKWFKLDVIVSAEQTLYSQFVRQYEGTQQDSMRYGIAFNSYYGTALLEAQINSLGILDYETGKLNRKKLNEELKSMGKKQLDAIPGNIYLFRTQGYFAENNSYAYKLINGEDGDTGRRSIEVTREAIEMLAQKSSSYYSSIAQKNGKFVYGYYPIDNEELEGYNMLRHAGTAWNLIMQYEMCGDERLVPLIDKAVTYLDSNIQYRNKRLAFVKDGNLLNVGGNGLMLLMYCAYAEVFGTDKYNDVIAALANGIIYMQRKDGSYIHTLNRFTYKVEKEYIIVYYDGEATFGMLKAYELLGDPRYLDSARKAADYFIDNDYVSLHSHWMAYTFNEITKYLPEEKYFEFGLMNVDTDDYSAKAYNTKAGINSVAETMNAAFEMYDRLISGGYKCDYLEEFNAKRLIKAVLQRAKYNLNYFMFPEYAMYFKAPQTVVNSFTVREDLFRIRIDDIQHFMDSYYLYWKNFDKIEYYADLILNQHIIPTTKKEPDPAEEEEISDQTDETDGENEGEEGEGGTDPGTDPEGEESSSDKNKDSAGTDINAA